MATIPNEEALGQRPTPQPATGLATYRAEMPGLEEKARAFTAVGADLAQLSSTIFEAEEKINTTRAEDAWNKYKNAALDLTNGEQGVMKLKGGDAVNGNIVQKVSTGLDGARERIEGTLANDEQKRRFKQRAQITDLQVKNQVLSHLDTENREYEKSVIMGSEAAAKSQIKADPTSQGVFEQARDTLMLQADAYLKNQGVTDKDAKQAYKDKINDGLWVTRIDELLYSKPLLAEALLRANADQIKNPEARLLLRNKAREVALPVDAAASAERIVTEFRDKLPPPTVTQTTTNVVGKAQTGDEKKLAILMTELNDPEAAKNRSEASNKELGTEIAKLYKKVKPAGGEIDIATLGKGTTNVAMKTDEVLYPNTSPMPRARDIAAQLPLMETRVAKMADEKFGPDQGNPDRAAWIRSTTSSLHARVASEVQGLNALQKEAQGKLIDAILGVGQTTGGVTNTGGAGMPKGITALAQITQSPVLGPLYQQVDPAVKPMLINLMKANLETGTGDEKLYWDTWNRIHLQPGDPKKIDFYQQILEFAGPGKLSVKQIGELRLEIDRDETPGGRSVNKMKAAASTDVGQWFKTNIMFTGQPERAIAANMRWNEEVGRKVDELVKAGTPWLVRNLFMMDSKESVINPNYLRSFVDSTPAQGVAQAAADARAAAPVQQPATIKTREELEAWFGTLPATQTTFTGTDGKTYKVPARAGGAAAPTTMTPTGQLVTPAAVAPDMLRQDGTMKGPGFLGPLKYKDGRTSTEISIGVNVGGKEMEIPTLVPTLTKPEIDSLLRGDRPSDAIVDKAVAHAQKRIAEGKPVWAQPGEQKKAPKAKDDLPAFKPQGGMDAQDQANHIGGLWQAVKTVVGGALNLEPAGRAMVETVSGLVGWLQNAPKANREAGARGALRYILEKDEFSHLDVPLIEAAVKYGDLDPGDMKKAKAMLKAAGR